MIWATKDRRQHISWREDAKNLLLSLSDYVSQQSIKLFHSRQLISNMVFVC